MLLILLKQKQQPVRGGKFWRGLKAPELGIESLGYLGIGGIYRRGIQSQRRFVFKRP
jgi:hypothetical protein